MKSNFARVNMMRVFAALVAFATLFAFAPAAHAEEANVHFDDPQVKLVGNPEVHTINQNIVLSGTITDPKPGQTITIEGTGINFASIDGGVLTVEDAENGGEIGEARAEATWPDGADTIPTVDPATNAEAKIQFDKFQEVAQNSTVVITLSDVVTKYDSVQYQNKVKFKITYTNANTSVRMSERGYDVAQKVESGNQTFDLGSVHIPAYAGQDFSKAVTGFDPKTAGVREDENGKTSVSLNGHIYQEVASRGACKMIQPGETFTFKLDRSSSILFDPESLQAGQEITVSRSGHQGVADGVAESRVVNPNHVIVSWGALGKYVIDSVNADGTELTVRVVEAPSEVTRDVFFNIPAQLMNPAAINRDKEVVENVNVVETVYHSAASAGCVAEDITRYANGSTNADDHIQTVPYRLTTATATDALNIPLFNVDVRYVNEDGEEIKQKHRELNQVIFNTPYDISVPEIDGYTFKEVENGESLKGNVSRYKMTIPNDETSRTKTFTLIYKKNPEPTPEEPTPGEPSEPENPTPDEPTPDEPGEPENPTPDTPATPEEPKSDEPTPDEPAQPSEPSKPQEPGKPAEPKKQDVETPRLAKTGTDVAALTIAAFMCAIAAGITVVLRKKNA